MISDRDLSSSARCESLCGAGAREAQKITKFLKTLDNTCQQCYRFSFDILAVRGLILQPISTQ
jgi:hypothetical protein